MGADLQHRQMARRELSKALRIIEQVGDLPR